MIYISIGHRETSPGACHQGFCEFDEAQIWAGLIVGALGDEGILVPPGTLREKVAFINARSPKATVEVHFNSSVVREGVGGCETLYYPGSTRGRELAHHVQRAMVKTNSRDRGIKEGYYRLDPARGVDFFLEQTKCPAVIIEPEFIFNRSMILAYRQDMCTEIAAELLEALKWL